MAFIVYLGGFYYQLSIPLLYKGVLLVSFAVIFAIVTLFLHARYKSPSQSAVENYPVFKAPIGLVGVFLIALLGAVNYKVQQFEDVLATGKPVVLKNCSRGSSFINARRLYGIELCYFI